MQKNAEPVVRSRVRRVELDRLPVHLLGAVVVLVAHVVQKNAEPVVRSRVRRVERDAARVRLVLALAVLHPVLPIICVPEVAPRIAMLRVHLDTFPERRDGLGPLLLFLPRLALRIGLCRGRRA